MHQGRMHQGGMHASRMLCGTHNLYTSMRLQNNTAQAKRRQHGPNTASKWRGGRLMIECSAVRPTPYLGLAQQSRAMQ